MSTPDLWVEKYRPKTLEGYVFKDENMKNTIQGWLDNKSNKNIPFPNLLLSGPPGVGKTTLAKMLLNELGVNKYDILEINGSKDNGIENTRGVIANFCSTYPVGDYKVILVDEGDYLTIPNQASLRSEIEKFANSVRFIITCNQPHKIIPPLHSRFQEFVFNTLDLESFLNRMIEILDNEKVQYDMNDLEVFLNNSYPDLRKCINLMDQQTVNGVLNPLKEGQDIGLDYMVSAVELFKAKRFNDARRLITSNAYEADYENIYKFLYRNLHLFGDESAQNEAIIIIARGLRNHTICADAEINLSATICELAEISK